MVSVKIEETTMETITKEADSEENDNLASSFEYLATITCPECNERLQLRKVGPKLNNGKYGNPRWIISNFARHIKKHMDASLNSKDKGQTKISKFMAAEVHSVVMQSNSPTSESQIYTIEDVEIVDAIQQDSDIEIPRSSNKNSIKNNLDKKRCQLVKTVSRKRLLETERKILYIIITDMKQYLLFLFFCSWY